MKEKVAGPTPQPEDETSPGAREPAMHRTVDRVTQILEEVVYRPGLTFAELARALKAPRSSVYGFLQGLLAKGWLYEQDRGFFLGPAVYGLTLASGQIRAGLVSHAQLAALHDETGVAVFLGVRVADHVFYVAEAGGHDIANFNAQSDIRRSLVATAIGKAILAAQPDAEVMAYLRRRSDAETDLVEPFLADLEDIRRSKVARNQRPATKRFAIATSLDGRSGVTTAGVGLVGRASDLEPRAEELTAILLRHVEAWQRQSPSPREPI